MRKTLVLIAAALVLSLLACAVTPVVKDNSIDLPPVLQEMEDKANSAPNSPGIKIIDYRMDKYTIWAWVDNHSMTGDCDYVVIGQFMPNGGVELVTIVNKDMTENPCQSAYEKYKEYKAMVEEAEANPPMPKNAV